MTTVYLGLGSNIGDRRGALKDALSLLADLGKIKVVSNIYESEAWGYDDPRSYLNMCCALETERAPQDLHQRTIEIEQSLGRESNKRKAGEPYRPRTIDIDILFYGSEIISTEELTIPHPRLHLRKFVLQPLVEIAPNFVHPAKGETLSEMAELCEDKSELKEIGSHEL